MGDSNSLQGLAKRRYLLAQISAYDTEIATLKCQIASIKAHAAIPKAKNFDQIMVNDVDIVINKAKNFSQIIASDADIAINKAGTFNKITNDVNLAINKAENACFEIELTGNTFKIRDLLELIKSDFEEDEGTEEQIKYIEELEELNKNIADETAEMLKRLRARVEDVAYMLKAPQARAAITETVARAMGHDVSHKVQNQTSIEQEPTCGQSTHQEKQQTSV